MQASTGQKIQLVLILAVVVAAIRVAWIFYERHQEATAPAKQEAPLNPDYYVTPKKLYPYDLKTARQQLTKQPAWVKVGYFYSYYPYDSGSHHADLAHEAGKLGPLEKFEINDVFLQASPGRPGERQILAVFQKDGKNYATGIGNERDADFRFYCNEMLFYEDPHELYKHWPADIWQAIDQHQVKPGMSELQADFAVGIGLLEGGGDDTDKTFDYPNGGKPLIVSYHSGKAIVVKPGKSE